MSPRNSAKVVTTTISLTLVLPALVFALSGCAGFQPSQMLPSDNSMGQPADTGMTENTVMTIGLKFMPNDITVHAGTTVTWQNVEAISHTVTSGAWGDVNEDTGLRGTETPDGLFDHSLSPKGQDGDTFSFTFDEPGAYLNHCKPHSTMNATVTVEP